MEQVKYVSKDEFITKKEIDKPNYYSIMTAEVRYSDKISDSAKLLFSEITALSNKYGYAFPSNQFLANIYNVSISTIQRRLKELKDNNFIKVVLIRDKDDNQVLQRQLYPITTPSVKSDTTPSSTSDTTPSSTSATYNNTRDNNINNNNKDVVVSKKTIDEIKEKTQNRLVKENIIEIIKQTGATEEQLLKMVRIMSNTASTINNPIGWLIKAIKNSYKVTKSLKFNSKLNNFHNFKSNKQYTNDELEKLLGLKH